MACLRRAAQQHAPVMMRKTMYLDRPLGGVAFMPASAMSHAALSTGAKQVGPLSRTTESALRYAASTPSMPWHPGERGLPLSAKHCDTT